MSNEHITDERLAEVLTEAYGSPEWTMADVRAARAVEAASLALRPAAQPVGWKTEALRLFDLYAANLLNNANAQATSTRDSFRALLSVPPAAQPVGEPVAKVADLFHAVRDRLVAQGADLYDPLYTTPQPVAVPVGEPMTGEAKRQWKFIRESLNKPSMYADRIGAFVQWFDATHKVTPPSNQPARTE